MKKIILALATLTLAAVLISCGGTQNKAETHPAPEGFSWESMRDIKARFLRPEGWYVKKEKNPPASALFISLENIEKFGSFTTGLSVNVVKNLPGKKVLAYIEQMIVKIKDQPVNVVVKPLFPVRLGPIQGYGFRIRTKQPLSADYALIQYLLLGNKDTNTLYIISFESPEQKWIEAWQKGQVILDSIVLNREM